MGLSNDERDALVKIKIERAKETINEVPVLTKDGFYRTAANRLYYACYYAASALLLKKGYEAHTHNGVISLLSLHFIRTEILSNEDGKLYRSLFELRQESDYSDWKIIEKEDIDVRLTPAKKFIDTIEEMI